MTKDNQDQKKKPNKALEGIQDVLNPNIADKKTQRDSPSRAKTKKHEETQRKTKRDTNTDCKEG